jgi:ubiquinone/menaquinone biosynthesis C-methylase UbiE
MNDAGSYAFGTFNNNSDELERLKNQASAALELERRIWSWAGLEKNMNVLDLACGPGIVSAALAEEVGDGRVLGVDINESLLQEARKTAAEKQQDNLRFRPDNIYQLNPDGGPFDFVYARFLFQHLEKPQEALRSVLKVLKPGGILCIADCDDGWLSLYPEPASFAPFTQGAALGQSKRGGDRFVGRKLATYLGESTYEDIDVNLLMVNSRHLGIETFLDLTTRFKAEQFTDGHGKNVEGHLTDIYNSMKQDHAWGYVGIFCAKGRRPL